MTPREAVYLGRRILVLGSNAAVLVFDEVVNLSRDERAYGSPASALLEKRLLEALSTAVIPNSKG
ncbi:hypothetical protein AGMMS4952_06600 [Spirochaetia bacterium]|nr:hypothetical protein AGMMS4952_06600 [Spirochaetia bacterium]